jgi:hypothetical protein
MPRNSSCYLPKSTTTVLLTGRAASRDLILNGKLQRAPLDYPLKSNESANSRRQFSRKGRSITNLNDRQETFTGQPNNLTAFKYSYAIDITNTTNWSGRQKNYNCRCSARARLFYQFLVKTKKRHQGTKIWVLRKWPACICSRRYNTRSSTRSAIRDFLKKRARYLRLVAQNNTADGVNFTLITVVPSIDPELLLNLIDVEKIDANSVDDCTDESVMEF